MYITDVWVKISFQKKIVYVSSMCRMANIRIQYRTVIYINLNGLQNTTCVYISVFYDILMFFGE